MSTLVDARPVIIDLTMTPPDSEHLERLAAILDEPEGADRVLAAAAYVAQLDEWRVEAIAIRDVEVWRLAGSGWGPTQLGQHLDLHKSRGDQLIRRAAETHVGAAQLVARLRRRVSAARRQGG